LIDRIHENGDPERALKELHEESTPPLNSIFIEHKDVIDDCFSRPAVEEILESLKTKQSAFASATLASLEKMSPLSLKVTFRGLNLGSLKNIEECLNMENQMSYQFMHESDFYEGVRAILVDKDRNPKWNPKHLVGVSEDRLNKFFDVNENIFENHYF
jgi:enoyl-CoA hydratase/carnithine racemase